MTDTGIETKTAGRSAPRQSFRLLRILLPKKLQPWVRGLRKRWRLRSIKLDEPYRSVYPYVAASLHRQKNLVRLSEYIEQHGIEGAVVECGVLDGGTAALMAYSTKQSGRPIHLFDAWVGMPETTEYDGEESKKWVGQAVGSPKRVAQIMSKLGILPERIHIHRGWFADTFPTAKIEKIALLHVDCDFYEPTALCLDRWYPHLSSGGYIQFDDYHMFQGCTKAVDEFLARHPDIELQTIGQPERGGAVFIQKK
jgi:O-methyltransferase